jgi:signal transduction histidine kinase
MSNTKRIESRTPLWERYIELLAVVWTVIIVGSVVWNVAEVNANTLEVARIQAQTAFEKDVLYRRWNAGHGGVYVPVTEDTQPNPYLTDIIERDITTPSGRQLTLMNPAYMTRQVHELAAKENGVLGHITSLNPIRPENAADPWETEALQAFEQGETVVSSVEELNGKSYMRLMRPLVTEEGCLQCHAKQGYELGDIRGGISVSVPMAPLLAVSYRQERMLVIGHTLLWLVGLGGITLTRRQLKRNERERLQAETEREHLILDLDAYAHSVAHDLKNPLSVMLGCTDVLIDDFAEGFSEEVKTLLEEIQRGTLKMSNIVEDLLLLASIRNTDTLEMHPLNMGRIVTEALSRLALMIEEKQAEIVVSDMTTWPTVMGQALWIEQVWVNYISNAIKYGGTPRRVELGVSTESGSDTVRFWVQDNGHGISPEDQPLLFVQFSRLDAARAEGYGLGLSIVRRIVEKLNGKVGVESEIGKGSRFYFELPLSETPASYAANPGMFVGSHR